MSDESKYRVEAEDDEVEEKKGFFRPLPEDRPVQSGDKKQPIVKLLGISMYEKTRDRIIILLVPFLVALINANVFSLVIIQALPESSLFLFVIPMLSAIPIGLTVHHTKNALLASLIASAFFVMLFVLFLISPALMSPRLNVGEFFVSGMIISAIYDLFVIFANLLGSLIGAILREFF
ncbi:MAG: hypothetical protein GF411_00105 [Candidatus Lokiarchaeota archaeon]|nr:hypothetical protein [Candidatus Lokiarchaeota archaeon]